MKPQTFWRRTCQLLDTDPEKVRLVGPTEFKQRTGYGVGHFHGRADRDTNVVYVRRGQGLDTYIHELLHILFPSRPHGWVFGAAFKLARVRTGRTAYGMWVSASTVKENRAKIIRLAQQSAARRGLAKGE